MLMNKSKGLYTVEGAFTIVIFTALFMMLLSIITVIRTEVEVQDAINQTAMELSTYSYAVGYESNISSENVESLKEIISSAKKETLGFAKGAVLCKALTNNRIDEKALKLVDGGIDGLDYKASNILGDGESISVIVIYDINVLTFGFVDKSITICQKAQTKAWLPYYSKDLLKEDEDSGSIWDETNFARGQYFISMYKEDLEKAVKSGQGIDLYDKETGTVTEIYSLNIFNNSYSYNSTDKSDKNAYSPNNENISKQILEYANDFNKDIEQCEKTILMDSGSEEILNVNEKILIIILPSEAKDLTAFKSTLSKIKSEVSKKGIKLEYTYKEEAL